MKQLMIDIETLDTKPSAAVLTVGAVVFTTKGGVIYKRYWELDVSAQLDKKRSVSWSTLLWWNSQNTEAKDAAFHNGSVPIKTFFAELNEFAKECNITWMNSPNFDGVILESLARQFKCQVPWSFWQLRCIRTLVDHCGIAKGKANSHNALEDCISQIGWILLELRRKL